MTLIFDDYNECWIWVEEKDHDCELSPPFDEKEDAMLWRTSND